MAYSEDYRKRVLEYIEEGHTQADAQATFKVGTTTIKAWKKLLSERKTLKKKRPEQVARVYPSDKLRTYINEHPQAILKEIAAQFGGSISGADEALKREKITLKKRRRHTVSEVKKNVPNMTKN